MHRPEWLSEPAEILFRDPHADPRRYGMVIVGSGYGGSVAAARFAGCVNDAGAPLDVCVLERGREHVPGTFPNSFSELPGHVRFSRFDDPAGGGARDGVFDLRIGKDMTVLVANGLGGGSLINAGVAEAPDPAIWRDGWPAEILAEAPGFDATWYQDARQALGVNEAHVVGLAKHAHLVNLFDGAHAHAARITVSYDRKPDEHGLDRERCVDCGDCVTGCNVGAKNTLSNSYLAVAWRKGAAIYTGATVSHIERRGDAWAVFIALTTPTRPLQEQPLRILLADHVVLAAGTLGSTEILLRSKTLAGLSLSDRLGQRFSGNGDQIAALYKAGQNVKAGASEEEPLESRRVGPTITGVVHDPANRIVIEELAVPGALRRVFEEIVTTVATLDRLGKFDASRHRAVSSRDPRAVSGRAVRGDGADPAAIDRTIVAGCQLLAAMGDDGARGTLQLVKGWDAAPHAGRVHDGAIRVDWEQAGREPVYLAQDRTFRDLAKRTGWTYLPSPLWQPFPTPLADALSGRKPTGLLLSVHPLGGCPMADAAEHGVVDHMGRVFCGPSGRDVHEGLLVLDGSIIPKPLGINPLLTITALAERAVSKYIASRAWIPTSAYSRELSRPQPKIDRRPAPPAVTSIRFAESLSGKIQCEPDGPPKEAELTLEFDPLDDLAAMLQHPRHPLDFSGTLTLRDPKTGEPIAAAAVTGSAELLVRGATGWPKRVGSALWTLARTRLRADLTSRSLGFSLAKLWGLFALASRAGEIRYMFYELHTVSPAQDATGRTLLAAGTTFTGRKVLEYTTGGNPWRQLFELHLTARREGREWPAGTMTVDPAYLLRGFSSPLQIRRQRDLPAAWLDLASLGLFLARIILPIHFWSFRLPKYQPFDPGRDERRVPGPLEPLAATAHDVPGRDGDPLLRLTRYRDDGQPPGQPVLLIHGLGASGVQFATPRVRPNLVQALAAAGFDVWVAELRTSIALVDSSKRQWTLDEVALGDVPRLVDFVLGQTGKDQIDVVAHCIGSAMFCTAVLAGRLQHVAPARSKIRQAVLLQVGPLVTLSKGTRLRALAAAPLMRLRPDGFIDFSVDDRADWVQSAIDRLLTTYPYPADEIEHHRLKWFDDPTIANCNRWAAIDGMMIRHEHLSKEMFESLGEVLGHSNVTTWVQPLQYGFLERLTDSEGTNAYVTPEAVRTYFRFPVRFVHGEDNDVFHPLTAVRSQALLRSVHGKEFPAEIEIVPRYRHLDPLIGHSAHVDVFPLIVGFLKEEHPIPEQAPAERQVYFRRPLIGPVLGWVRGDGPQQPWRARIWCRLDDLRSPVTAAVVQVSRSGGVVRCFSVQCPSESQPNAPLQSLTAGPMDTVLCVDVELGREPGAYEIAVLSAHEGPGEAVSDRHRKAEWDAGRRVSASAPHLVIAPGRSLDDYLGEFDDWRAKVRRPDPLADSDKIDHAVAFVPERAAGDELTLGLASCRYPGWLFDRELADLSFRRLSEQPGIGRGRPAALFLVGDQIYSDATAGVFDPRTRRERFYEAYREAWTAPYARAVMSHLPVYMMMDDHEAGNDWHPDDVLRPDDRKMRAEGLRAFRRYQWLHSPGNRGGAQDGPAYYDFDLHGFPVFVCDTRSGRSLGMLDRRQFESLTGWLGRQQRSVAARPKFVVSPSVLVPFKSPAGCPERSDGWDRFPGQLAELFAFIVREGVDNVVFLCGDAHLGMHSEIWFEGSDGQRLPLRAWSVVASAMYAPYPFVNAPIDEFALDGPPSRLDLPGLGRMRYAVRSWSSQEGVTLVDAAQNPSGCWDVSSRVVPARARAGVTNQTDPEPVAAVRPAIA